MPRSLSASVLPCSSLLLTRCSRYCGKAGSLAAKKDMNLTFTLIAQAITFGLFIWFTASFVWPPLQKAILERQTQIADGLAAGERGKQDLVLAGERAQQ